jgi:hypothetical protein
MSVERLPHLIVTGKGFFRAESYKGTGWGRFSVPARDRNTHGTSVREQLERARSDNAAARGVSEHQADAAPIQLEVRSEPGFLLKLASRGLRKAGGISNVQFMKQIDDLLARSSSPPEVVLPEMVIAYDDMDALKEALAAAGVVVKEVQ